jgi:rubrerythrin
MASSTTVVHRTLTNLQAAYEGESNARAKYTAFAVKADQEGFRDVASLFRAAARVEQIHAENHARVIRTMSAEPTCATHAVVLGTTRDNLLMAIEGEEYERDVMYPRFIAEAIASNQKGALRTFKWALEVEAGHARLYRAALDNLRGGRPQATYYVCVVCGFTTADGNFARCLVCDNPRERFETVKYNEKD